MGLYAELLALHAESEQYHLAALTEYPASLGRLFDHSIVLARQIGVGHLDTLLRSMTDQAQADDRERVITSARLTAEMLCDSAAGLPEEQRAYLGRYLIGTGHEGTVYQKGSDDHVE
jgi:hypothetical protein